MTGGDRRAARRAETRAWAQKNKPVLVGSFAVMTVAGLLLGKLALAGAGLAGMIWILLATR